MDFLAGGVGSRHPGRLVNQNGRRVHISPIGRRGCQCQGLQSWTGGGIGFVH